MIPAVGQLEGDPPRPASGPGRARLTALREAGVGSLISTAAIAWIVAGAACTVAWALVGSRGYYWPVWVWAGAGAPVAAAALLRATWRIPAGPGRWAGMHAALAFVASALLTLTWLLTGRGEWLAWVLLGLGVAFAVHALLAFADRLPPRPSESALHRRVDELVRTRSGALDVQATEMRRIERDLHDGAQARLVALSLALGRAEQRLVDDPEARALVRSAREDATAALAELRDLSRGIAPPLLEERGLVTAVEALAARSPLEVRVEASVPARPDPALERAAYFVVSEALTNVVKHASTADVTVRLATVRGALVAEVLDDGPGGADPFGSGLAGLRRRVEALDGTLVVAPNSPRGSTVRAELPCGS